MPPDPICNLLFQQRAYGPDMYIHVCTSGTSLVQLHAVRATQLVLSTTHSDHSHTFFQMINTQLIGPSSAISKSGTLHK